MGVREATASAGEAGATVHYMCTSYGHCLEQTNNMRKRELKTCYSSRTLKEKALLASLSRLGKVERSSPIGATARA